MFSASLRNRQDHKLGSQTSSLKCRLSPWNNRFSIYRPPCRATTTKGWISQIKYVIHKKDKDKGCVEPWSLLFGQSSLIITIDMCRRENCELCPSLLFDEHWTQRKACIRLEDSVCLDFCYFEYLQFLSVSRIK